MNVNFSRDYFSFPERGTSHCPPAAGSLYALLACTFLQFRAKPLNMILMVKNALVTGASQGIGRATALLLASSGWKVTLTARSVDTLEKAAEEARKKGGIALVEPCDLTRTEEVEALARRLEAKDEALDLLVLNAGVGVFKPFEELTEQDWTFVMDVNLKGTTFLAQKLLPLLKRGTTPRLIVITSDVARRTFSGGSLYCMSKYAQDALVHTLRKELRPAGVRVSVIMPGLTDTSFGGSEAGAPHKAEWLRPDDLARSVAFIAAAPSHVVIDEMMVHPFCQDWQP